MNGLGNDVVVAIDGSPNGDRAVAEGVRLAASHGATLHIVCAHRRMTNAERKRFAREVPNGLGLDYSDEYEAEARMLLSDTKAGVPFSVRTRLHPECGTPGAALARVAARENAAAIVVAGAAPSGLVQDGSWSLVVVDGDVAQRSRFGRFGRREPAPATR